jgi:hypothetical protein
MNPDEPNTASFDRFLEFSEGLHEAGAIPEITDSISADRFLEIQDTAIEGEGGSPS